MGEANRARRVVPVVVIAILIVAAGIWGYRTWRASQSGDPDRIEASGTIEADETHVASLLSGRIEASEASEGKAVKKDDVLFRLDDRILKLQVDQAEAGLKAARAALSQAKDDDESKAEIAAAQARVDQAKAQVEMAKTQRGYAVVKAPADGTITAVSTQVGENASPGRTMATLADLTSLRVSVYVPETQVGLVQIGDSATISADGSDRDYSGRVSFIASQSEFTPNSIETKDQRVKLVYEVRVEVDESGGFFKPGMPVDVILRAR